MQEKKLFEEKKLYNFYFVIFYFPQLFCNKLNNTKYLFKLMKYIMFSLKAL